MLLNKGSVPYSMGLNPQSTQQFGQTVKNTLTSPSTWAKGLRRFGLPLSLLLNTNEAQASEKPGFFDQLQQQGMTQPHEQQQAIQPLQNVNTMQHEQQMRDARQSLGSNFTEQEAMRPQSNVANSWETRPQAFTGEKIDELAKITSPGGVFEWKESPYHKNGGYISNNEEYKIPGYETPDGILELARNQEEMNRITKSDNRDRDAFVDRLKYLESIGYFENDKGGNVGNDWDYRSR